MIFVYFVEFTDADLHQLFLKVIRSCFRQLSPEEEMAEEKVIKVHPIIMYKRFLPLVVLSSNCQLTSPI